MNNTKNIMIIYGSEAYLMEEGRRQFFEAARKRSGGDAEVQTFQKDAAAATVVESFQGTSLFSSLPQNEAWVRGLVFRAFAGRPVAEQSEQRRTVVPRRSGAP